MPKDDSNNSATKAVKKVIFTEEGDKVSPDCSITDLESETTIYPTVAGCWWEATCTGISVAPLTSIKDGLVAIKGHIVFNVT